MKIIVAENAPKAIGPYSQAIAVTGSEMLFLSGLLGLDPDSGNLIEGGVEAQTTRTLENMGAILIAAGMEKRNVVKTTIYLADLNDFEAVNSIYGEFFGTHWPARSTVQVAALPRSALIEIEAIAVK